MSRGFKLFLVGLLAFCVLFGAFCILYPLLSKPDPVAQPETPIQVQPTDEPEPPKVPEASGTTITPTDEPVVSPHLPQAQAMLETMTRKEKVYQLFMVTPEALTGVPAATRAGDATKTAIEAQPVGGVVYFAQNLETRDQTTEMIRNTQSYAKIPLLIGVDEEGGIVSRLGSNPDMGTTKFPNMATFGASGDAQSVFDVGRTMGKELSALGFNLNFAPVADVLTNPANTEIGPRSFSADPAVAAKMVGSLVAGLQEAGIPGTLKHFPGHGGSATDTHNGQSVTTRTLADMRTGEFIPFQAGIEAGVSLVMVGHMTVAALYGGSNTPADFSSDIVTDILRTELGFTGVIITDSHAMGAITQYWTPGEAAVKALTAGVDIVLMPDDLAKAAQGVLDAIDAGTLSESRIDESVLRVLTLKYQYGILT